MNPYEPSSFDELHDGTVNPATTIFGRVLVILYGVIFSGLCILGTLSEFLMQEPFFKIGLSFAVNSVACFGVFALAVPALRYHRMSRFWRYYSIGLPVIVSATMIWEIQSNPELSPMEIWLAVIATFVIFSPAVICNLMLSTRLRQGAAQEMA